MKLCIDCAHYNEQRCEAPEKHAVSPVSMVSGAPEPKYTYCHGNRVTSDLCGKDARWFKEKPPATEKVDQVYKENRIHWWKFWGAK